MAPRKRSGEPGRSTATAPTSIDEWVGMRVRLRRQQVGMSAERLGELCGVSRQQVDKWEKGNVRISAGRLHRIATILETSVAWFFDELPGSTSSADGDVNAFDLTKYATFDVINLVRGYSELVASDKKVVRRLVYALGVSDDEKED